MSLTELYDTVYQPKAQIIGGLFCPGAYLFAGAPKVGNSFFMAQLGYHVSGGIPLWDYPVHKGTVLYLALEDNYARLQKRLSRMFGTDRHLSVQDYKKVQRIQEVVALEQTVSKKQEELSRIDEKTIVKQSELDDYAAKLDRVQNKLEIAKTKEKFVATHARRYDDDSEYQLPEPKPLMSAKAYHEKVAFPLISKLKDVFGGCCYSFSRKRGSSRHGLTALMSRFVVCPSV